MGRGREGGWGGSLFDFPNAVFFGSSWRHYELTIESSEDEIAIFFFHFILVEHQRRYLRGFEARGSFPDPIGSHHFRAFWFKSNPTIALRRPGKSKINCPFIKFGKIC
jgi:hypothetical protein